MRRAATALLAFVAAVLLSGCFAGLPPEPWNAERAECEAGIADALAALGPRATATTICAPLARGGYDTRTNTAVVDYREAGDPDTGPAYYARVAVHELGHAWDRWHVYPSASTRYGEIRGNAALRWCDDPATPEQEVGRCEDYADVFVRLIFDADWYGYGFPPVTAAQRAALCSEGVVPC